MVGDLRKVVNDNVRLFIDKTVRRDFNKVNLHVNNSLAHEMKKAEVCYNLLRDGNTFLTEVHLKQGGRPDILVMDINPPIAYEILCTEKEENLLKKQEAYGDIKIIGIRI